MTDLNVVRGHIDLPFITAAPTVKTVACTRDPKVKLQISAGSNLTLDQTNHHNQKPHRASYKVDCCENLRVIAYRQKWNQKNYIEILQDEMKKLISNEVLLVPFQGVLDNTVYNGPIIHCHLSTGRVINYISTGDACHLKLTTGEQGDGAKTVYVEDIKEDKPSFIDSCRFLFETDWSPIISQRDKTMDLIIVTFMLKNAKPDEKIYIFGGSHVWEGAWKRYFQNLGIAFTTALDRKTREKIEQKNTQKSSLADIFKTVAKIKDQHQEILREINSISDIIPEALSRQFGFSINENKYRS